MAEKKQVVTYTGLKKIEEELQDLKVINVERLLPRSRKQESRETYLRMLSMMRQRTSSVISKQESSS